MRTPAAAALPDARRWRRTGIALVAGIALAAIVSMALQWFIGRLQAPWPSPVRLDYVVLSMSVVFIACVGLALWRRWARWALPASWVLLAVSTTLPISLALLGTRYYFGGVSVDQNFRTEYLTRMTSSTSLADFAYHGIAPYYPGGWFWLGGRFANLIGMPGWAAFKPWSILTLTLVAIIGYELWALVTNRRVAFVCSLVTAVLAIVQGADEPYSWLATAAIPPLAILAWRWVTAVTRDSTAGTPGIWATPVALGIAAGVFGDLYTLYAGFFVLLLLIIGVAGLWRGHRDGDQPRFLPLLGKLLPRYVLMGAIAFVVVLPCWLPYLGAVLGGQYGKNVALHYLPDSGAQVPLPMLQFNLVGVLTLLGTVWLALQLRRTPLAGGIAITVGTCYLWYLLSFAALPLLGTTLLAFRIYNILTVALSCAGVFGTLALLRALGSLLDSQRARLRAVAAVLALGSAIGILQGAPGIGTKDKSAFGDYYPTGSTPVGRSNPGDKDYWVPQLNTAVRELSGRPPQQNILLSNQPILTITSPYWAYQASSPHYANPLADFNRRNDQVESWSKARTPAQLRAELDRDRDAPTVFVLQRSKQGYSYRMTEDVFPAKPNVATRKVTFDRHAFDGPGFVQRDVGPYTVIARKP